MRIVKSEKIFLSQEESDIYTNFCILLERLKNSSEDSETVSLVENIENLLSDLWEKIEDVD